MGKPSIKLSRPKVPDLKLSAPKIPAFQMSGLSNAETKPETKQAGKIDIKNFSLSEISEQLDQKFKNEYLKKNYSNALPLEKEEKVQSFRSKRDLILQNIDAFKTYDFMLKEKEKQLVANPDLKVRTTLRDEILSNPNSPSALRMRASWLPEGENYSRDKIDSQDFFSGAYGGLGGAIAGFAAMVSWNLSIPQCVINATKSQKTGASEFLIRQAGLTALKNSDHGFLRKFLSKTWLNGGFKTRIIAPIAFGAYIGAGTLGYVAYKLSQAKFNERNNEAKANDNRLNTLLQDDIERVTGENRAPSAVPTPTPTPLPVSSGGGGGGFSSCFIAGTKVTMKDGSYKDIEKVKLGDEVLAYDEVKKITYSSPVVLLQNHIKDPQLLHHFKLSDGTEFTSNAPHAIYVENFNTYKAASEIYSRYKNGEKIFLKNQDGKPVSVDKITTEEKIEPVYNLHVDGVTDDDSVVKYGIGHNYYANGVLVHNAY